MRSILRRSTASRRNPTLLTRRPRRQLALLTLAVLLGLALWPVPAAPPLPASPDSGTGDGREVREGQLVLNEFMASNDGFVFDEFGDDDDWVEIHNLGPTPVNLEGKFLTDDLQATQKWEFPDTIIPVGGHLIVWADDEPAEGPLHATFKLEKSGEQLGLFDYIGVGNGPIDTLTFGLQGTNISYGRYPDGTGAFTYMEYPTPGEANQPHVINLPPFIANTEHLPGAPTSQDIVTIRSRIADDAGVAQAKVFYNPGSGYNQATLYDDGLHHDVGAGDQLWGAQIQPYPNNTVVLYYIWARDDFGGVSLDPPNAPQETYAYVVGDGEPVLFINEFLASNETTLPDEYGEYDDWLELYNGGTAVARLLGLYVTDDLTNPDKFALPDTTIPAGGFLLIWCDEDGSQGPLHANFKISASGEELALFRDTTPGAVPIDSVTFGPQTVDVSLGRFPDGGVQWQFFTTPTPGATNGGSGVDDPAPGPFGRFALLARPNPFGAWTTLAFELVEPADVELRVVDAAGRSVYSLVQRGAEAGPHRIVWRGVGGDGAQLPGGIYCCRIQAGTASRAAKVLLVR